MAPYDVHTDVHLYYNTVESFFHSEDAEKLVQDADKITKPFSDFFKSEQEDRYKIIRIFYAMVEQDAKVPGSLSKKSKEAIFDALIAGISENESKEDKRILDGLHSPFDWFGNYTYFSIPVGCLDILSHENMINAVDPKRKDKAVKEALSVYDTRVLEGTKKYILELFASVDYSDMPKEVKKAVADKALQAAFSDNYEIRRPAAQAIERTGDAEAKKKVGEHYLSVMENSLKEREVENAMDTFAYLKWEPAAKKILEYLKAIDDAAESIEKAKFNYAAAEFKKSLGFALNERNVLEVLGNCGNPDNKEYEAAAIRLMHITTDRKGFSFEALGKIGGKDSKKEIEAFIEKNKGATSDELRWDLEDAHKALKEIDRRLGVPVKPAEERIKESIEGSIGKKTLTVK